MNTYKQRICEKMSEHVVVVTNNGPVRGRKRTTFENIPFVSFHGIPYGKPPVGDLRFKAPQPVDNWTETLDATVQTKVAAGLIFASIDYAPLSTEDCLQLNIYTPSVEAKQMLPVMVWIHGGGFSCGSIEESVYGPDFLLRKDVVLVSIAYRLGPFGFLSVADPKYDIPGNAGLKDQSLGLRWVQANIERFGGDPDNVTVFGESAGSMSTHCHMASDYSKDLFHKAILQSGTAIGSFATQTDTDINSLLAKNLGWNGEGGVDAMMDIILKADAKSLAVSQMVTNDLDRQRGLFTSFLPCIEPYGDSSTAFFYKPILEHVKTAWANSIPLIIGSNADECALFAPLFKMRLNGDDPIFENYSPRDLGLEQGSQRAIENGKAIKRFYFGETEPTGAEFDVLAKLLNDRLFWHPAVGSIRIRARTPGSAPTFMYRLNFDSQVPSFRKGVFINGMKQRGGVCVHGEDLMYIFRQQLVHKDFDLSVKSPEAAIISKCVDIWTSFARTGNPNCGEIKDIEWTAIGADDAPYKCLQIAENTELIDLPEWTGAVFWDSLFKY